MKRVGFRKVKELLLLLKVYFPVGDKNFSSRQLYNNEKIEIILRKSKKA